MKYGFVIIGIILLIGVNMFIKNNKMPELGHKNGVLKELSKKPNGVSTQTNQADKKVLPLPFKEDLSATKTAVIKASQAFGACEIVEETDTYIHMVFTTGTMKYKDDVEFYFDTETQQVEYRSESRVGYSDMGLNKDRYEAIVSKYKAME